jgi:hypothetical protein
VVIPQKLGLFSQDAILRLLSVSLVAGCLDTRGRRFLAIFPAFLIPSKELAKMQQTPGKCGTCGGFGLMSKTSRGNVRAGVFAIANGSVLAVVVSRIKAGE